MEVPSQNQLATDVSTDERPREQTSIIRNIARTFLRPDRAIQRSGYRITLTSVTIVVSLTLLRVGQWERLAFAFANTLAKWDISRAIAHPLVP